VDETEAGGPGPEGETPAVSIGTYRIVGKVGEGGMGVVFEAEQASPRRRVALKVLRGGQTDERARMLEREAEALARLRHPNIAAIYEAGRTADGVAFFAMELVRGPTLDRYLDERGKELSDDEISFRLRLFQKVADAVHYAHQRGVIHRDLKPGNIIVVTEEAEGEAVPEIKILDFGIARITDSDVAAATQTTGVGKIVGTLCYMSPEQARGDTQEIDTRTDVYALGVILYEMLTGSRPHDLRNLTFVQALRVLTDQPGLPLEARWPGPGKADDDVATIAGKALDRDVTRRYASAAALSEDVERYLTSQPILAKPPTVLYQARKFAGRNRVLVGGIAATLVTLVAGVVVSTVLGLREAKERRRAEAARDDVERVASFQAEMLERVDPEAAGQALLAALRRRVAEAARAGGADATRSLAALDRELAGVNATDVARDVLDRTVLEPAEEAIGSTFGDQPRIEARLRGTLARTYRVLGLDDSAEKEGRRAVEILKEVEGTGGAGTAAALRTVALVAWDRGKLKEAESLFREALAASGRPGGKRDEALLIQADLASVLWAQGRYDEAEKLLDATLAEQTKAPGPDAPATLETLDRTGGLRLTRGRLDEAAEIYGRVLEGRRRVLGPEHVDTLDVMNNLGVVYLRRGDYARAEPLFLEALEIEKRHFGEDHPKTLATAGRLALLEAAQGRYEEALALQRRTFELRERSLGPTHPQTMRSMNNLGVALTQMKRFEEADRILRRLLTLDEEAGRTHHPDYAVHLHSFGELALARGDASEATRYLEKAHALYKERESPNLGLVAFELAQAAARRGDRDACLAWLVEAKTSGYLGAHAKALEAAEFRFLASDPRFAALVNGLK
jgi:tetratricopeptide (TPR) repeat protein/tRNA A-37 threonylcarbamoyl transferase component Bud32